MFTNKRYFLIPVITVFLLTVGNSFAFDQNRDRPAARRVESKKIQKRLKKAKNWYIRLKAEAPEHGFIDNSSLFGQIRQKDAANQYSLKALAPFGGDYLYITFIDPIGVDDSGEYKTSFHSRTKQTRKQDSWEFTVKSSDPDNDIILSWSDFFILQQYVDIEGRRRFRELRVKDHLFGKRMKLVDSLTFAEVPMISNNQVQSYSFNMQGMNERSFIWVLKKRGKRIPVMLDDSRILDKEHLVEIRKNAKRVKKSLKQQRMSSFDLNEPPLNSEME